MEDEGKKLDGIRQREALIDQDAATPLHLIREKELELSGRVLQAREKAAESVTAARLQAAEIIAQGERDADAEAKAWEEQRMAAARAEAEAVRSEVAKQIEDLNAQVAGRKAAAIDAVVERVVRI